MNPTGLRVSAVVLAILTVVAAGSTYYYVTRPASSCSLQSTNPLVVDQPETPDSLDPAVTFSTPGWAAVQQVYQELIQYNQSSSTSFVGELAKNWSHSLDSFHWNFTLWPNEKFSNGDPVNAYVVWYSLYRDLVMNQASSFILNENFWFPGEWYYASDNVSLNWNDSVVGTLVNFLNGPASSNFFSPSSSALAYMEADNQSFRVINATTIQFNLGYGYLDSTPFTVAYSYVLPELSAPNSAAVDPAVVDSNGGVAVNSTNTWMSENMVGSGPFTLASFSLSSGFTLTPSPNYWAQSIASQVPYDNEFQPAKTSIETLFQGTTSIDIRNLEDGEASAVSFAYVGPGTVSELQGVSCVTVQALPTIYGATAGSWWVYMNQNAAPFNNLSVRAAVVHAIDYQQIIADAFGGYAEQWVGPVPPSYPGYTPSNLPNYSSTLGLAEQEMNASPYPLPGGYGPTLNYAYLDLGDWANVAQMLQTDLGHIGIKLNLVPISLNQLYVEQGLTGTGSCVTSTGIAGGPFNIGQEFYTSDYISPDDWTFNDAVSWGSANLCESGYSNATVDNWISEAAGTSDPSVANSLYANITHALYYNYTDAWLVVPTSFAVYSDALHGFYENPMGSAIPYVMAYNTMYGT